MRVGLARVAEQPRVGVVQVRFDFLAELVEQLAAAGEDDLGGLVVVEQADQDTAAEQEERKQYADVHVEREAALLVLTLHVHRLTS